MMLNARTGSYSLEEKSWSHGCQSMGITPVCSDIPKSKKNSLHEVREGAENKMYMSYCHSRKAQCTRARAVLCAVQDRGREEQLK